MLIQTASKNSILCDSDDENDNDDEEEAFVTSTTPRSSK